jgi:precorrin-2 dehydrogenase
VRYYPVYLNLEGRACVVVGGGPVAEGKVAELVEAGARVTVVSPALTPRLAQLVDSGRIEHRARPYRRGDLAGALVAIGGTDDRSVNREVWKEARDSGVLLNLVDDPPRCGFIAPAVVRRGDLAIAVSTGGKAPTLAVRLRERIEELVGDEHARFLELAGDFRAPLARAQPSFEERRERWYRLVDSDVLELLRRGEEEAARSRMREILGVASADEDQRDELGRGNGGEAHEHRRAHGGEA